MKKVIFLLHLCVIFLCTSCTKNNDKSLVDLKEPTNFEDFFDKVSQKDMSLSDDKILIINYEWNNENKTIKVLSTKEAEPSLGIAMDIASKRNVSAFNLSESDDVYTVECIDKDGKSTTKNCKGKFDCGRKVYNCVEAGGCATICKLSMAYHEGTSTFYLSSDSEYLFNR